ncbi:hypothetical protein TNCV_2831591 [Trichonephila clavipes]|nr:hypothetical protein TNCV_2831591 [Trichonephila clavipes]
MSFPDESIRNVGDETLLPYFFGTFATLDMPHGAPGFHEAQFEDHRKVQHYIGEQFRMSTDLEGTTHQILSIKTVGRHNYGGGGIIVWA